MQNRERKYREYVRGWVEYFRLADMKGLLKTTDEWARRRIRAVYWKQWKRVRTRYRILRKLNWNIGRQLNLLTADDIVNIGLHFFSRMFDLMLPPVAEHSIVVA